MGSGRGGVFFGKVCRQLIQVLMFEEQRLRQRPELILQPAENPHHPNGIDSILLKSHIAFEPLGRQFQAFRDGVRQEGADGRGIVRWGML